MKNLGTYTLYTHHKKWDLYKRNIRVFKDMVGNSLWKL